MTALDTQSGADVVLLTVPEACSQLRISRWTFYRLVQRNELTTITIGRRRLIASSDVMAFVNRQRREARL